MEQQFLAVELLYIRVGAIKTEQQVPFSTTRKTKTRTHAMMNET